jgi:hypothetical protein
MEIKEGKKITALIRTTELMLMRGQWVDKTNSVTCKGQSWIAALIWKFQNLFYQMQQNL